MQMCEIYSTLYYIDVYKGATALFNSEVNGYDKIPDVSVIFALKTALSVLFSDIDQNKENLK